MHNINISAGRESGSRSGKETVGLSCASLNQKFTEIHLQDKIAFHRSNQQYFFSTESFDKNRKKKNLSNRKDSAYKSRITDNTEVLF